MNVEESERRSLRYFLRKQARERLAVNNRMQKVRQLIKRELDKVERQTRKDYGELS